MKFIPRLPPKESRLNQFLELFMVFTLATIGTYTVIFFGSAGGRSRKKEMLETIVHHQAEYSIICLLIGIGAAIVYFFIRSSKTVVVYLEFDDQLKEVHLGKKAYYRNEIENKSFSYDKLDYKVGRSSDRLTIGLFHNLWKIGTIDTAHVLWEKEVKLIQEILKKLYEVKEQTKALRASASKVD